MNTQGVHDHLSVNFVLRRSCGHDQSSAHVLEESQVRIYVLYTRDTQVRTHIGGGGRIRLIVGFQPLMVISPTASWIRWCMRVS